MKLVKAALHVGFVSMIATAANAQVNGNKAPEASLPFTMTQVGTTFNFPWRIAFLPDGRMLITEKTGAVWLVTQKGEKTQLTGVPKSLKLGNAGLLGVYLSPHYATDHNVYLTYTEPGEGGPNIAGLALARAKLTINGDAASLQDLSVIWRAGNKMDISRGNMGAQVTFSPDGKYLLLTNGDQFRMAAAQDPNVPQGKIFRLTLDGKPAPGNPGEGKVGTPTMPQYGFPPDTIVSLTNQPITGTVTLDGPNLIPAETWAIGFRCPYGLAFAPNGDLWEVENGPTGGDELNLIKPGKNYGWPVVSYGVNDGKEAKPIPLPPTHPEMVEPVIYWTPVIAPGSMEFYKGAMFPQWNGNLLVTGLASKTLNRIVLDGKGGASQAERWDMGHRIRDVEVAPDGAIWVIEDDAKGGLWRVTPK